MKKAYLLFFSLFLFASSGFAQEWLQNLPKNKAKENLTLFDFQKAFNTYWDKYDVKGGYYTDENGVKQKAPGWKQFKRDEYFWSSRVNRQTGAFPKTSSIDEYLKWKKQNKQSYKSPTGNWTAMGPESSGGGYSGTGRLNCIAFHPSDNNTYWVGAPSGGLWKTTDDGTNWTVLTDNNDVLGVSDIAVSPDYVNDNTIYIATGDKDGGSMWSLGGGKSNDNNSIGVLKSTDGGNTWSATGLSFNVSDGRTISRLLIHPTDNDILYAATNLGIYKTTDAGASWNLVYDPTSSYENIIDMEFKPGDPSVIYASTKRYWDDALIKISTDDGANWSTLQAFTDKYRVDIAVTPDNPDYLYGVVAGRSGELAEIGRYDASASTWTTLYAGGTDKNLLGYYSDGSGDQRGQAGYDLCIDVSPTDANTIIIGGVISHKSTDGGLSWTCSNCWTSYYVYNKDNYPVVHADQHMLKYRSNGDVFECNDGGVYVSTDDGTSWTVKTGNLVISQLYRLSVAQTRSDAVLAGLQDNGCKRLESGTWTDVKGGDGMEVIIDYNTYDTQYGSYTNGDIARTTSNWSSATDITKDSDGNWMNGISSGESAAWVTPYAIDPTSNSTLYLGLEDLWKSTDNGDSWTKISTVATADHIRSLALAPSNSQYIYMADPDQFWVTTDGGASWTERTTGLPVASNTITYIAVKADDPQTVWVTFGGFDTDRIYQSTDAGANWTNISTGLPSLPVMSVVQNKLNTDNPELYVGTDAGVYVKVGANDWAEFNSNLPNVIVNELEIYYDTNAADSKLRAATSGRGLWESDLWSAPSTPTVTTNSVSNITTTSAESGGNVIDEGASAVTERGIVWSTSADPTTSTGTKITDSSTGTGSYSATITGLSAQTVYHVRAYAINGSGTSYGNDVEFMTDCNAVTDFPFTEGFEDASFPPNCWTSYRGTNDLGTTNDWKLSSTANSGTQSAYVQYEDVGTTVEDWLVTPLLDLPANSPELSFYEREGYSTDYNSVYYVKYSTSSQTDIASFTDIISYDETALTTNFAQRTIDLSTLAGQSVYLAFVMQNDDGDDWYIDDIEIKERTATALNGIKTSSFNIYPNPSSGIFTLNLTSSPEKSELKILNILGKVIVTDSNLKSQTTIDLSKMPKGIYFVELILDNQQQTCKIVIK